MAAEAVTAGRPGRPPSPRIHKWHRQVTAIERRLPLDPAGDLDERDSDDDRS